MGVYVVMFLVPMLAAVCGYLGSLIVPEIGFFLGVIVGLVIGIISVIIVLLRPRRRSREVELI